MRSTQVLIAGLILSIALPGLAQEEDPEVLWKNGNKWFRIGSFDEAIISYTKAIEKDPGMHKAYNTRGQAYYQKDDLDAAVQDYSKAIGLAPQEPKYYNNRGNAYREKGDLDKALADFNKTVEIDSKYKAVYFNRCALYHDMGKMDLALADCTRAVEMMSTVDEVWIRKGILNLEMKNLDEAVLDFSKAISLQKKENIMAAYRWRSKAYQAKGDWASAIKDMSEALEFDRTSPEIMAGLAMLLATVPDESKRDGKKALELAAKSVALTFEKEALPLEALAAANAETGDFAKAVEFQKKAMEIAVDDAETKAKMQERLNLYENKKPYREGQE